MKQRSEVADPAIHGSLPADFRPFDPALGGRPGICRHFSRRAFPRFVLSRHGRSGSRKSCALAIATPSAILSGIARAARGGVLIKGGAPLEELGSLSAMAFDKTGTLTEGRPRITDVVPVGGTKIEDLLTVAISVESMSDHPLAVAIVRDGEEMIGTRSKPQATNVRNLVGRGVQAELDGQQVWIGKVEMFGADGIPSLTEPALEAVERLRQSGRTTMIVRRGDRDLGAIGLLDTPREGVKEALQGSSKWALNA